MTDELLALLEEANPVPDPNGLLADSEDARRFEAMVEHRRLHARDVAMLAARRGVMAAAIAAVIVLLAVGSVALFARRSTPEDAVTPTPPSVATLPVPTPTNGAPPAPTPIPFQGRPSLALAAGDGFTEPGGVVFHGGQWHLFYRSVDVPDFYTAAAVVGRATSDDGRSYRRAGDVVDVSELSVPFGEGRTIQITDAIVREDGAWVLYFHTVAGSLRLGGHIGQIVAPGPDGPWTLEPEPVLAPGPDGAWDAELVGFADVLRVGDEYWMFYDGFGSEDRRRAVGLATSPDGVTWTKRPAPVLTPGPGTWDESSVFDPSVVVTDDGFVMTYRSFGLRPDDPTGVAVHGAGVAVSQDGVTWTKHPANPFFDHRPEGFELTAMSTLFHTGGQYVFLADLGVEGVAGGIVASSAWALVHEGPIRTDG